MAEAFADWIVRVDGGQKVIKGFVNNDGEIMYTVASQPNMRFTFGKTTNTVQITVR